MEENIYKFDDSKDTHRIGVKKNKFTHHRDPEDNVKEFNLGTGWPENGYAKDEKRITDDSPSYEGEAWFLSKSFNDSETNKRPLHPTKDYFHPHDEHTGDDHLDMGKGNYYPAERIDFEVNPNVDNDNYTVDGQLNLDKKGGEHLRIAIKEENPPNGYIYNINKNDIKMGNLNEQIDRIKQMIQFKEGMNYKDVQQLTEKASPDAGLDLNGGDKGASAGTKSAEAEMGVAVSADGEGMEIAATDKEVANLAGPSLEDQMDAAVNGKDGAYGDVPLEGEIDFASDVEKAETSKEAPESNFEKKEEPPKEEKADDVEAKSSKEEAEKAVEKAEENVEKAKEDLDNAKEDLKKEEEKEEEKAEEPAKEKEEPPIEDSDGDGGDEETSDPSDPTDTEGPGDPEGTEAQHVMEEILNLQAWMIEYLQSGGNLENDEYQDVMNHHYELFSYYNSLKNSGGPEGPVGPAGPARPKGPVNKGPVNTVEYTTNFNGQTYTLNVTSLLSHSEIDPSDVQISTGKDGTTVITMKGTHGKYGPGRYEGVVDDGQNFVHTLFYDTNGEVMNEYKVPLTISKSKEVAKQAPVRPPVRTTTTAARGAYSAPAPFGLQGVKGIGGRAKSMGPFSEDPFVPQGKVDPSRWKNNKYDNKEDDNKDKKKKGKPLAESTNKRIIKLRERDLYRIVEKVIREKRNTKRNIKEYWMQDVADEIKKDHTGGSFRQWCKKNHYGDGCSDECIREALKTDDKLLHFRAGLAKAFCHSNHDHRYESRRPRRTLQEKWKGSPKIKSIDKWGKEQISFTKLCAKGKELSCKDDKTARESEELKEIQFALRSRKPGKAFGKIDAECKCDK
jgi:hypothetical protein